MKEVRPPKRPLIFYYCVAMLILLLFNFLAMPWMARQQIQEVDYGTDEDIDRTRIFHQTVSLIKQIGYQQDIDEVFYTKINKHLSRIKN